jgi:hypothetical protein
MSVANPAIRIRRRSVEQPDGEVGLWVKMFDPPTESPDTPELLNLSNLPAGVRANPVPEVMAAAGLASPPPTPHLWETDLLHGLNVPSWDNRPGGLTFFTLDQPNNPTASGTFPGPTVRIPRGSVFHSSTSGKGPPPHTIHWHGQEPTPMNDGVGHCSMEIGTYTYQFQPNFMGFYFYHCHRNTVQHFEFGLYGAMLIHTPDAFHASLRANGTLNSIPIGASRDGRFRVAANLRGTPLARLQTNFRPLTAPDPRGQFPTDPHAHTVPYDVEALWVVDDRDSVWSDIAGDARDFFPAHGPNPGVDDEWSRGIFNEYRSDYWFVTGIPVVPLDGVKRLGNTGRIAANAVIPPALNGGIGANAPGTATQVPINARVNDTILIRVLDAAYNYARVTFPADVVIIAFDGRALGVPPFGRYNHSFVLKKGTPILLSTARRFDCLMRPTRPIDSFAKVEFLDTQSRTGGPGPLRQTARIPIRVR